MKSLSCCVCCCSRVAVIVCCSEFFEIAIVCGLVFDALHGFVVCAASGRVPLICQPAELPPNAVLLVSLSFMERKHYHAQLALANPNRWFAEVAEPNSLLSFLWGRLIVDEGVFAPFDALLLFVRLGRRFFVFSVAP